jgi:hypothetical protein
MPIVMYLGRDIKEYREKNKGIINQALSDGKLRCEQCLKRMRYHSSYDREIKESGETLTITVVWCRKCKKWRSLQPDFLLPCKHYSGNEIEGVIIDSATEAVKNIDITASESTVRRWIAQISERIVGTVGRLKHLFDVGGAIIDAGHCYSELEQILEKAPQAIRCSGNKLGLANIWLRKSEVPGYI